MGASNRTVIFLHIPKTGGTTLNSILSWQYMLKNSVWTKWYDQEAEKLDRMKSFEKKKLSLVRGHFLFGVHRKIPNRSRYITLMRNPIRHVQSEYAYYRKNNEDSRWNKNTVEEILCDDSTLLDNTQTRRLSGLGFEEGRCTKDDFRKAVENIEKKFEVVGITEKFDESIVMMKEELCWGKPLFYSKSKVNKRYEKKESREFISLVIDNNKWDMKLYERQKEEIIKRIKNEKEKISKKVENLKQRNRFISPLLESLRGIRGLICR